MITVPAEVQLISLKTDARLRETFSPAAEEMDQGPDRSALGSDDVTDESNSVVEVRWSSGDEDVWGKTQKHREI